ncbi:MAG: VOC family protein [Planctomycetes bacterium]|nr:VOC family protein [Planctomycetota bacterium]MBL7040886.1 VOC family protein [Pirellulaceae bacterium]
MIQFEHFALNVEQPHEIADWYVRTLGCQVLLKMEAEPHTVFLADANGRVFWELYKNSKAQMSRVCHGDPAVFHVAVAVDDLDEVKSKVWEAGGTFVEEVRTDSGSVLLMMRDPWGIALQLCSRVPPFVGGGG